ncbi:MAG: NADH-quinone oxidoreductase subunit NuoG [Calditrichia bacterium]
MAKIYIDGKAYEVDPNKNLLEVCLSLGYDLPYFCWHPAMGSVGACRQCAIKKFKDEDDKQGKLFMACMEPASDGTRISITDPEAVEFRASVIEWLMTNHPHDCPICDEGGECHLQDMTVMTGHTYRRHRYNKRTYRNQDLGPFINHEMNRCIQCYRCVRFYREYADGRDLNAFAAHNHVYFGRQEEGMLENEFSGNLVEVCPTGVFTDKTLKEHYNRKWDLTASPSICHHCGLGCNIIAGERYGGLRRILSRYNGEVNGYFICDRGRFGYGFVNSQKRIRQILRRGDASGKLEPVDKSTILKHLDKNFSKDRMIGIGSPRASLESNYMLKKLVGENNYYIGISGRELKLINLAIEILQDGPAPTPSMKEAEKADVVLVLGEDLTNTAPMLALALRQAARQKPKQKIKKMNIPEWNDHAVREALQDEKGPFYVATSQATKLDEIATKTWRAAPDDIARLGFDIAHSLNSKAPAAGNSDKELKSLIEEIAEALKNAENPLIVSGTGSGSEAVMRAAANIAWALCDSGKQARLSFAVQESNSMGAALLGGQSLENALERAQQSKTEALMVLENDLYRRAPEEAVNQFFDKFKTITVLDYLENRTTERAHVVIPVGTFAEADGTIVNNEGRAQRFYQAFRPDEVIQESWRWLRDILAEKGHADAKSLNGLDDFSEALIKEYPFFKEIRNAAPPAGFRIAGEKIPRQPHRYSGRTAMTANIDVNVPKPPDDSDSALSFTMEGYFGRPPSSLIPFFWSPGWNSAQSINKYQTEVGGPLRGGDPGRRLIEPSGNGKISYFTEIPEAFHPQKDEWLIVPVHHIFGSEELSVLSESVSKRVPQPYVDLNPGDAAQLKIEEAKEAEIELAGNVLRLPVKYRNEMPQGLAGLPVGLPGMAMIDLPARGKISGAGK